jgi:hypothetical protein
VPQEKGPVIPCRIKGKAKVLKKGPPLLIGQVISVLWHGQVDYNGYAAYVPGLFDNIFHDDPAIAFASVGLFKKNPLQPHAAGGVLYLIVYFSDAFFAVEFPESGEWHGVHGSTKMNNVLSGRSSCSCFLNRAISLSASLLLA